MFGIDPATNLLSFKDQRAVIIWILKRENENEIDISAALRKKRSSHLKKKTPRHLKQNPNGLACFPNDHSSQLMAPSKTDKLKIFHQNCLLAFGINLCIELNAKAMYLQFLRLNKLPRLFMERMKHL